MTPSRLSPSWPMPRLQFWHIQPRNKPVSWSWSNLIFFDSVSFPQQSQCVGIGGDTFLSSRTNLVWALVHGLQMKALPSLRFLSLWNSSSGSSSLQNWHSLVDFCPVVSLFGFCVDGTAEVVVLSSFPSASYQGCCQAVCMCWVGFKLKFVVDKC